MGSGPANGSKPVELLPDADPLTGLEYVHVVQDGSSRKVRTSELGGGGGFYHYGSFAVDSIGSSEILMDHIVASAHTIEVDFAGCVASVGTPPAAPWVATIFLTPAVGAPAAIGSITIDGAGLVTFSVTAEIAIAAGDVVSLIAPVDVDASIARLRFTFRGIM